MIRRILRSQKGFTLIELLVAVGILAVLAGIAVPVVIRFTGTADTTANAAEFASVQTAVDALLADQGWGLLPFGSGCTAPAAAEDDMAAFPCATDATEPTLYGENYLRQALTDCTYTVVADGTVSQAACP